MCGLAGILEFDRSAPADRRIVERMTELLAHRGPDDAGCFVHGNVALGHRRLSIIDPTPGGHQPMANDDGSVWIVHNGECYNHAELARDLRADGARLRSASDTEVLLRLYEARGERFLEAIDGMFALAVWDRRRRTLLVARDRLGIKPLFYFADRRHFLFASEMKALLADPSVPLEIDPAALSDYLHLLSIPDPRCILSGVRKLRPGHYLRVTGDGVSERRYWDVPIATDEAMGFEEACAQFHGRFESAVRSHLVSDVPVGAFLSGGVDSSAIVATAARSTPAPIETFSITFPGQPDLDEGPFAARVAAHCGARLHATTLALDVVDVLPRIAWHADEPFAVSSALAVYALAEHARARVKVVLSGDGGDEVFAGYPWRHVDLPEPRAVGRRRALRLAASVLDSAPVRRWFPGRLRAGRSDRRYLKTLTCYADDELEDLLEPARAVEVARAWETNITQRYLDSAPGVEQLARKLYTDVKSTLVSEMLTKVDRMTMAHGLEARVPFLDHRLVEWAFTVPGRHKLADGEGKRLVKRAMEAYLPRDLLHRPKHGFNIPLPRWLRGELREFTRDHLAPSRVERRGIFRSTAVTALLDAHESGRLEASNRIFVPLMLELWMRRFVDDRAGFLAR